MFFHDDRSVDGDLRRFHFILQDAAGAARLKIVSGEYHVGTLITDRPTPTGSRKNGWIGGRCWKNVSPL